MNTNKFRKISRFLSLVFMLGAFLILLLMAATLMNITGKLHLSLNYAFKESSNNFVLLHFVNEEGGLVEEYMPLASLIILPFFVLSRFYILFRGSQAFKILALGETPFQLSFAYLIKRISLVLIVTELALPLLLSGILALFVGSIKYFYFGLSGGFLIGLILFLVSETFFFGIELQELADETV